MSIAENFGAKSVRLCYFQVLFYTFRFMDVQ